MHSCQGLCWIVFAQDKSAQCCPEQEIKDAPHNELCHQKNQNTDVPAMTSKAVSFLQEGISPESVFILAPRVFAYLQPAGRNACSLRHGSTCKTLSDKSAISIGNTSNLRKIFLFSLSAINHQSRSAKCCGGIFRQGHSHLP